MYTYYIKVGSYLKFCFVPFLLINQDSQAAFHATKQYHKGYSCTHFFAKTSDYFLRDYSQIENYWIKRNTHTHSFIYCLRLLSPNNTRVEQLKQRSKGLQYLVCEILQKKFANLVPTVSQRQNSHNRTHPQQNIYSTLGYRLHFYIIHQDDKQISIISNIFYLLAFFINQMFCDIISFIIRIVLKILLESYSSIIFNYRNYFNLQYQWEPNKTK